MGTSAFILMKKEEYSSEKLLADSIVVAFRANVMLYFDNSKRFTEDGSFTYTTLTIRNKPSNGENKHDFILYIDSPDNPDIEFYYYEDLRIDPDESLCKVGCIENVSNAEELIFRFIYEYLKLNPDNYFWTADYDWVYSWEDMQKLKSLPYDPDWCYKNPKLI
ncbi:hypothetical protein [Aneurinibacillus aneurinilyticus]|jgi:hypothetical protein|uniref:Uncharacterized protein n=1 Tax=Aneurinibacillus aneurinilyticus ATCC 12856 TaxID=649747 RepID=U1WKA4_ANEAE|nr:hypothetical protein [Aneurinibacillus aneurinilyticus]ERI09029.1 hypothetical protein HMPREF0083_02886 [Aneurinibacillus aneurinilyticus ATCC 12856]MCI1696976.1 hypothetical protein [Aneurinibacillus aneurinilyticus]MED0705452.1 hypothetical protein [Aneurinibacillus aneurinilyticus]MED0724929.1 hypothetical protein [Aneurinibacillus aneurinilyticus]MED0731049.1 hypothetical protein [Aneurinibacillus aneurinilyticus]